MYSQMLSFNRPNVQTMRVAFYPNTFNDDSNPFRNQNVLELLRYQGLLSPIQRLYRTHLYTETGAFIVQLMHMFKLAHFNLI